MPRFCDSVPQESRLHLILKGKSRNLIDAERMAESTSHATGSRAKYVESVTGEILRYRPRKGTISATLPQARLRQLVDIRLATLLIVLDQIQIDAWGKRDRGVNRPS